MGLIKDVEAATKRQHTPKIAFVANRSITCHRAAKPVAAAISDLLVRALSISNLHHAMMGTAAVAIGALPAAIPARWSVWRQVSGERNAVRFNHPSGTLRVGAEAKQVGNVDGDKAIMSPQRPEY